MVIDDWILATVHMWVIDGEKVEARRRIETHIPYEKLYEAFVKLSEKSQGIKKPVKHTNGAKGTAIEQTAKEIVDILYDLDKHVDCPRFFISSRDLCQVPITATSNSDVIPLGSRLEELEKTVGKLVKGLDDMKNATAQGATFASITATGGGGSRCIW